MATLSLREHELTFGVPLTIEQRDQLAKVVAVRPSEGREQTYDLTPGSTIGALRLGDLDVVIQPKVPMDRVFFGYNFYSDNGASLNGGAGTDLQRQQVGFEKTFLDGDASFGMRKALRELGRPETSVGPVTLKMHVGVHSDVFDFFLVGESHRELLLAGSGVTNIVSASPQWLPLARPCG